MAVGLALIFVVGALANWVAWRIRLPAILVLLAAGLIAGPATGWIDPDAIFGASLLQLISIAVALILFEGALSLDISEIKSHRHTLFKLVTVGALASWLVTGLAAHYILGLTVPISTLLGAVLVVTGPTVVLPLVRHVRPSGAIGALLKWEGIVIDPIGATLALLVFEGLIQAGSGHVMRIAVEGIALTLAVGIGGGVIGAASIYLLMRRYWLPDHLQNPVILAVVLGVFVLSNHLMHESGFLTVTVMGALLGNQRRVSVSHVIEFKENLRVLLIATLFIVLAARLDVSQLGELGWPIAAFLAVIVLIGRPLAVAVSTIGSTLGLRQRAFLAWMAPRGVVAAAVSAVFALRLQEAGFPDADKLVPVTFATILATVALYGLTAAPVARRMGVAGPPPQGFLFIGAHAWARQLAKALRDLEVPVLLADTNRANVREARLAGLKVVHANVLDEDTPYEMELEGIGRLLALTDNEEVNRLAAHRFIEIFGRSFCFRLPEEREREDAEEKAGPITHGAQGRVAFEADVTSAYIRKRLLSGSTFKVTRLTDSFSYEDFQTRTRGTARLLFVLRRNGEFALKTADTRLGPRAGDTLITLADVEKS